MSTSTLLSTSPFALVIFGATGDLARRKLVPALFSLFKSKNLPGQFSIIGFARRQMNDEEFQKLTGEFLHHSDAWKEFKKHLFYQQGLFDEEKQYHSVMKELDSIDEKQRACVRRFFYLATPPHYYETILNKLEQTKLSQGCKRSRHTCANIVVEKPFGKDLETAKSLDKQLSEIFKEEQIYRVDHYLGKETVQNMIAFRFANSIFEPVWNNTYIDHVQITFAEEGGVKGRGQFFDGVVCCVMLDKTTSCSWLRQ